MKRNPAAIFLAGLLIACTPQPDHVQTVLEFQAHKNAGDLDSALELFSDNPVLNFGPLGSIEGLQATRGILEYDVALNTHLEFSNCVADGLEISCQVVESNDWLKTAGIEFITYDENRFAFGPDGRVESISATLSADSAQAMGAAVGEFHQWATANQPEAYAELFSDDGSFVYSRDNAEKVLVILRAWRDQ